MLNATTVASKATFARNVLPFSRRSRLAFGFNSNEIAAIYNIKSSLLNASNTNLSQAQKEVLLWHQCLPQSSIPWIQSLMWHKQFLPCSNTDGASLHKGPFIRTNSRAPSCNISGLKCAACLYAIASARTPSNLPRASQYKL